MYASHTKTSIHHVLRLSRKCLPNWNPIQHLNALSQLPFKKALHLRAAYMPLYTCMFICIRKQCQPGYTHDALRARNFDLPDSEICKNVISNHRTRRDGKTMTRTMRQTEACSSFVRIQHGCSRSKALFFDLAVDSVLDSLEPKFILKV